MVFARHSLLVKDELAFVYNFFAAKIVGNQSDNHVFFKNVEKIFLIDIMKHNQHTCN